MCIEHTDKAVFVEATGTGTTPFGACLHYNICIPRLFHACMYV